MSELTEELEETDGIDTNVKKESTGEKAISVPDLVNMNTYLLRHCKTYLLGILNEKLATGELSEMLEIPVVSERIRREQCLFPNMMYWRLNRSDFLADIDIQVQLQVETEVGDITDTYGFYISLWFNAENDFEYDFFEMNRLDMKPDRDYWKLDQYLIPILHVEETEQAAEDIWRRYCPEAIENHQLRNPEHLAQLLELPIVSLRLYQSKGTKAVLCFQAGSVLVQDESEPGNRVLPPPREVPVAANTIILNECADKLYDGIEVFHECIHYEWHYMFFKLQETFTSDTSKIKKKKVVVKEGSEIKNPLAFMENQARRGCLALLLPHCVMKEKIHREYQRASVNKRMMGYFNHEGWKYDTVARSIAAEFSVMKYLVKKRIIMMGHIGARGALNFVDGRYIVPFAYSPTYSDKAGDTYVINRKGLAQIYHNDPNFRKIMSQGDYVFVDGHVCCNDTEFVRMTADGARLTPWANAHVDACCLRFQTVYIKEHTPVYHFGMMNSDEEYNKHYNAFLDKNGSMTSQERKKARDRLMKGLLPLSFSEALVYLMRDHGNGKVTVEKLAESAMLSRITVSRLRNEERASYPLDIVIALCIGLHLPPWLSAILLEKAHLTVPRYGKCGYYGEILDCLFMDTIRDVQDFLEKNEYPKLKLNDE